jgi:transcriptional regulator with AAA-type ATPase domain
VTRARSFWPAAASVAYVSVAALELGASRLPWLSLLALPLLLAEVWRRTEIPDGTDRVGRAARSAVRACVWGVALWLAARTGPAGRPALDAAANLGIGTASVAALVALARIEPIGGMLAPPPASRSLDAAAFTALLWAIATAVPATYSLLPAQRVRLDPLLIDYATTSAGLGSILVLVAATYRLRALRRLELGVGDRAGGALALAITAFSIAVPATVLDIGAPDRVLPVALGAASLLCAWAATTPEPTTVSSALRGIVAVMILGAPTTLAAGYFAHHAPAHADAIVLAACAFSILIGLSARAVARPLGPEQSRWLLALEAAGRGVLQPEPDAALRAALVALSGASRAPGGRPEIWRSDPPQVLSVDVAGYLHVEAGQAPDRLYALALGEPERTLRAEALAALEVRRPEVRGLLAWFEARGAFSVTVVVDEDGPIGFISLPRRNRSTPMTLEEARAVRQLGDRVSALLSVSSALARARERELAAEQRADAADDECRRLEHIILSDAGRQLEAAERLARPVRTTAYSPAARLALDRLGSLGRRSAPIALLTPPGVDAVGWAAHAHLESPRAKGPFVVVDATNPLDQRLDTYRETERSPLRLADGGTLLILDAAVLPLEVQEWVSQALSQRGNARPRGAVLPLGLMVSVRAPVAELVAQDRLSPALARWIGDCEVKIPPLAERSEDLRALSLDALARLGLGRGGEPLGIDNGALRLLAEHSWPANELELSALLVRAARLALGSKVTMADLVQAGLAVKPEDLPDHTPRPPLARRARPRRLLRGR